MNKKSPFPSCCRDFDTLACTLPSQPVVNPPQPPEDSGPAASPQPPTPEPTIAQVLFRDDFSNPNSGWDVVNVDHKSTDYQDGGFRLWINDEMLDIWSVPHQYFPGDVRVEVDATKIGGPDANDFGVICRYTEDDANYIYNFYFFIISSDGRATIAIMTNSQQRYLTASGDMEPAAAVRTGNATNHIRADCIGSTLTLYVNGQMVAQVIDPTHPSGGDVGLIAGTWDEAGVEILFDNFVVTRP
jgi:hypothetical protein